MIRFDHVSKRFDDGTVAVDNFELTVESHHLVVLLGSSGCGKTTLLRMVNRMVDPSEGRILIDDTDVATVNPVKLRRQIGYVMQSGGLFPTALLLTTSPLCPFSRGFANCCPYPSDGLTRKSRPRFFPGASIPHPTIRRAATTSRGGTRPGRQPRHPPHGRAFRCCRPGGADRVTAGSAAHPGGSRKTIVFVTHDVDEAFLLGDEVLVLRREAQVAQRGRPDDILLHPIDDFVSSFIGGDRRNLHMERHDDHPTIVDASGRLVGRFANQPSTTVRENS